VGQLAGAQTRRQAASARRAGIHRTTRDQHYRGRAAVNWQNLMNRLAPLRRQWDLAVLTNLAAGTERPGDLIDAINSQAGDGRRIGWKVLNDTLRRLERGGYVTRQEMPGVPRETRYWLRPPGHQLLAALRLLDTWYDDQEPGDDSPGASSGGQAAGNCNESSEAARTPRSPAA
jgi:DNA-binding HxlR family transcriptional regulator